MKINTESQRDTKNCKYLPCHVCLYCYSCILNVSIGGWVFERIYMSTSLRIRISSHYACLGCVFAMYNLYSLRNVRASVCYCSTAVQCQCRAQNGFFRHAYSTKEYCGARLLATCIRVVNGVNCTARHISSDMKL